MSTEEVALSTEETDHLVRSTKKQKASSKPFSPRRPILSYKDSVLRPSFDWEDSPAQNLPFNDEDAHSDIELDNNDPYPTILLSREEKIRTRTPWRSTLIVKAFGKLLGFKCFDFKIRTIWKLAEDIHIIDLGLDYFLIHFKIKEDY